jgi:hypothetical protein
MVDRIDMATISDRPSAQGPHMTFSSTNPIQSLRAATRISAERQPIGAWLPPKAVLAKQSQIE